MNTYDPADGIRYVHLAVEGTVEQAVEQAVDQAVDQAVAQAPRDEAPACRPLDAGYANRQLQHRLAPTERPALVVLPGGATDDDVVRSPAAASLRLA
jgi:hypothetical protein